MPELASSHVQSAEYDDDSNELTIRFQDGSEYVYYHIPRAVYDNLLAMPSPGDYFRTNIKGIFEYLRVA